MESPVMHIGLFVAGARGGGIAVTPSCIVDLF